jgi:hypothetical protein
MKYSAAKWLIEPIPDVPIEYLSGLARTSAISSLTSFALKSLFACNTKGDVSIIEIG